MSIAETQSQSDARTDVVRFHLSLNVDDLAHSVEFFAWLLDVPAARHEADYAKFEIDEPPLVLSLAPNRTPGGGKLNHLGIRLTSHESLVALQQRLEAHGLATEREEGVECCHSQQTKFWLADPDGNLWEFYTLDDDAPHPTRSAVAPRVHRIEPAAPAPAIWAHRLGESFPPRLLVDDDGVDEVFLQGTFNARLTSRQTADILGEVFRVLKPGAKLSLHQLSARSPLASLSRPLPGPAAAVEAIPSAEDLARSLESAGFVDIHFEKFGSCPCFVAEGVECRETRLIAHKPAAKPATGSYALLYRGPFRQLEDDRGNVFRRGQWTPVDADTFRRLQEPDYQDRFVV